MESVAEADTSGKGRRNQGVSLSLAIEALANAGYGVYRKPEAIGVTPSELRPLENHLWHLSEICADLSMSDACSNAEAFDREWSRVVLWLRMAAGLGHVEIDLAYGEPVLMLCGRAEDYHEAISDSASAFSTEQTRLLYGWNAVERLLKVLSLPATPNVPGTFNRATRLLTDYWDRKELPRYFDEILDHLRFHVENDPWLRAETRLRAALQIKPWRAKAGFLLAIANQLRHLPAHGALRMPSPHTWGADEPRGSTQVASALHAPRLAVRGLALSLQMLVMAADLNASFEGLRTPERGWWFYDHDGQWHRGEPSLRVLLEQAHVRPPSPERYGLYDPDSELDSDYSEDHESAWE